MKTGKVVIISIITVIATLAALIAAKVFIDYKKKKKNEAEAENVSDGGFDITAL